MYKYGIILVKYIEFFSSLPYHIYTNILNLIVRIAYEFTFFQTTLSICTKDFGFLSYFDQSLRSRPLRPGRSSHPLPPRPALLPPRSAPESAPPAGEKVCCKVWRTRAPEAID